jgi:histidinol dehydrogenase
MNIVDFTPELLDQLSRINEKAFDPRIQEQVGTIIQNVRDRGDDAILEYTKQFDGIELHSIKCVSKKELLDLHSQVDESFLEALREAIDNVRNFHLKQVRESYWIEGEDGVRLGMRYTPLSSVGLYVPGGAAAYPSTIVMNAVPAQVAGVERIAAVTPPARFRENPHVAAAFVELGIDEVYTVGGVQAIAALAYGTKGIVRVDKIVGPGNLYVAIAKKLVFGMVDIDMVAGPSEIVVVGDESTNPAFVAADLLSQAEHGSGLEKIILLTDSRILAEAVDIELKKQVENLNRADEIKKVLDRNEIIIVKNNEEAADTVNTIAPEHLELMVKDPYSFLEKVKNAGAVFLGEYSPEPVSDYFAGPNHVLPTSGSARYASPLGVYDFQKCMNVVEYTFEAIQRNGLKIDRLARAEGFDAHARAVTIRMKSDNKSEV